MPTKIKKPKANKSEKKKNTIPYHKKPDNMSLDDWQIGLRRQFATLQEFKINKLGSETVFSDYSVYNPQTKNSYKVALRSNSEEVASGQNFNFCSCYDFKTNGLGTCKHIEAVINKVREKKFLNAIFQKGNFHPPYSSVYLDYSGEERKVKLRIGTEESRKLKALSRNYFSDNGTIKSTAFEKFDQFLTEAKNIQSSFRCYEDALTFIFEVRDKNRRKACLFSYRIGIIGQNFQILNWVTLRLHADLMSFKCFPQII